MNELKQLALLHFSGSDVRSFLQGQLSNDLQLLSAQRTLLASCNSAQGRVQAVLTLIERSEFVAALLPAAMVETTAARLRKYVMRSKVTITVAGDAWSLFAATRADLEAQQLPIPSQPGEHLEHQGTSVIRWRDPIERFLILRGANRDSSASANGDHAWQLADIRAGLPQVFPETHESFVAQMLNLDTLGGISFNKGCYTGQEIIARAHFRGAVKRRMFRFAANCAPPTAGTRVFAEESHAGEVVMSAAVDSGCELLAVLHLTHREQALTLEAQPGVTLQPLELPYPVPTAD